MALKVLRIKKVYLGIKFVKNREGSRESRE